MFKQNFLSFCVGPLPPFPVIWHYRDENALFSPAESLSIISEKSWRTGDVPEDWRKANVTPIFKKSKEEDPGNYRPVSLTSIPGKMMEQLFLEVIIKQVEEKKVIRSSQHGFTKGKSCLTNLIAFYDA